MNIYYLETLALEVPFSYIISFFQQDKLSVYFFIGLHYLLPEAAIRVEVFCKKGVLIDFVNFLGKHLCWSISLTKFQAWHLFQEHLPTTAFAMHSHHSLSLIRFTLYSAPSSSSLLLLFISPMFLVQIRKASKNLNLVSHFHWSLTFIAAIFFFHVFSVSRSFVSFFLVAAYKKDSFKLRVD